jgi:hypothetical protein
VSGRLIAIVVVLAACEHGKGGGAFPDGGSGVPCGSRGGTACPADEFCDFGRNSCGTTDENGTCRTRPNSCDDSFSPTCGCDGVVYSNPCDANAVGVDTSDVGGCEPPPGQFSCGHTFCDPTTQYCQVAQSDVGGEPAGFQCNQLPSGCMLPAADCNCLADEPCGDLCTGTANRGFEVTCLGG